MRVSVKNSLVGALTVVMDEPLLESPPTTFINVSPLGTPTGVEKFIFIIVTVVGVPTNNYLLVQTH